MSLTGADTAIRIIIYVLYIDLTTHFGWYYRKSSERYDFEQGLLSKGWYSMTLGRGNYQRGGIQ